MKKSNRKLKIGTGCLYFFLIALLQLSNHPSYGQDILKLVPANASGVFTMDGNAFFKKIDLDQINRLDMFKEMDEKTKGKKGDKYNEYSKIYKDPASIGLNLNSKSYIFFESSEDTNIWGMSHTYSGLVSPLSSSKKFESFIKKVTDSTIHKYKDYKYTISGYRTIVAWNKSSLLMLWVNGWGDNIENLLTNEFHKLISQSAETSIRSNKNFMEAQTSSFDFHYWMNFESYFESLGLWRFYMEMPFLKDLPFIGSDFYKEYYFHTAINFNKGDISMISQQHLSEESFNKIKDFYRNGINPDLMKYINKDHLLGAYSMAVNQKKIIAVLDTALHDSLRQKLDEGFISFLYEKKINSDPQVLRLQAQLDSMYTDLYPPDTTSYNYNYDYNYDTYPADTAYDYNYEDYSDTSSYNYDYNYEENIEDDDNITTDTIAVEQDYNYDYNYNYYSKEDSIYDEKYKRIDLKRQEINTRKELLAQQKMKEVDIPFMDVLEIFEGDALAAITDLYITEEKYMTYEYDEEELTTKEVEKTRKKPLPEYLVMFTLNNPEKAKKYIGKLTKDSFLIKEGNHYYIEVEEHKTLVAISGNTLLITNNKDLINNHLNGYPEGEKISAEIRNILLNRPAGFYANLKDIIIRLPEGEDYKDKAISDLLANSFQYMYLTSEPYTKNINQSDFKFYFTNKIDNSFYEIFRIINEVYKIYKTR